MAWVTTLGPAMEQIDYRLKVDSGCSLSAGDDGQVAYRLDSDRPLEWVGDGLREVGIQPGTALDDAGVTAARALANGRDPSTGEQLVTPKLAVHPEAKLEALPLVDAVRKAAADAGVTPAQLLDERRLVARFERLQRGVAREQDRAAGVAAAGVGPARALLTHRAPVADLEAIAAAAGVDLADVYEPDQLAHARQFRDARVPVGNRGYDLTLDLPKSYSVLVGLAPAGLAGELEDAYLTAVRETVTAMQGWAGYGMRGHHGDGQTGTRVEGTGLLGWMTVHRTARPVPGAAPDPHLHAHVTLLNLIKGVDGKWSTVGAGGRDIHRHAHAADGLVKARLREITRARWGIEWARDERTGAWEVSAVPPRLRAAFGKRGGRVAEQLRAEGLDPAQASTAQAKDAAYRSREAKLAPGEQVDLRTDWREQATRAGVDVDGLVAAATPGPAGPVPAPAAAVVAEQILVGPDGLTGHRKVVTRADVLAGVLDALPGGITELGEAEQLVDQVLAEPAAVALPPAGASHLSNADRYTSADVLTAERTVLAAARDRFVGGYAVLPADVLQQAIALFETGAGFQLGAEQRAVLERLAGAGHGVDAVIGVAGAGKTTIMAALRVAYEASGYSVAGASTAAVAAQHLQAETDIESRTIASWLHRITTGPGLDGVDVLVVDEAAMVDDRHMARLLTEAGRTGTKVIAIGDPQQLRAVGIGGTFAAVHELVNGLSLADNRRQQDVDEREALALWRDQQRRAALHRWDQAGRVHVTGTAGEAHAAMVEAWVQARAGLGDLHEQIDALLLLAHTNADVDTLNRLARQTRVDAGELGAEHTWQLADGGTLTLAVGDVVMTRTNDRALGVLNGHRGVVVDVDRQTGRVQVERRLDGPDGPELVRAWVPARYVEHGGVQLAYAITAAKSQGLTARRALVYGPGMDAYVLYPAMSRDRYRVDLWLALDLLEDDADRARLGAPRTDAEARARAIEAYATALERDLPDRLVLTELGEAFSVTAPAVTENPGLRPDSAAYWRAVAETVAELPDSAVRAEPNWLEQSVRRRRAGQDPAGYRAAEDARRRAMAAELQSIAAGGQPSGRYPRSELAALAGQLQAAAARHEQQVQLQGLLAQAQRLAPDGASDGYIDWRRRPYGAVPTDQLQQRIATAGAEAARWTERARSHQATADRLTEQATAGAGPAVQALLAEREQLAARVAVAEQVAQLRQAAAAARDAAQQAWQQVRQLDVQGRRNPIMLRLSGTSRAEIAAERQTLRNAANASVSQETAYRSQASQLEHEAGGPIAVQRAAGELATRDWAAAATAAAGTDQRAADRHARAAERATASAAQHSQLATQLRGEAELRGQLPPLVARVEDVSRRVEQTYQQTIQAQQAPAPRIEPAHEYHQHYPDPGIDHGPTLGR